MSAKYTIRFNNGKSPISGLSFDEAIDYKINNLSEKSTFTLEEEVAPKKEGKKKDKDDEKGRSEFISRLSDMQKTDIKNKRRKVAYSEEGEFYYLKVIDDSEIHISDWRKDENRKKELREGFRAVLSEMGSTITTLMQLSFNLQPTEAEIKDLINSITFIAKKAK